MISDLVPIVFFIVVYKIFELFVRRNERRSLINQLPHIVDKANLIQLDLDRILGVNKQESDISFYRSAKIAAILLGAGTGLVLAFILVAVLGDALRQGVFNYFSPYEAYSNISIAFAALGAGFALLMVLLNQKNRD